MKIIYYSSESVQDSSILKALSDNQCKIITNQIAVGSHSNIIDLQYLLDDIKILFSKIDAIIFEGSQYTESIGLFLTLAISYEKPILYLIEKGNLLPENLSLLSQEWKESHLMCIQYYNSSNLKINIDKFLDRLIKGRFSKEKPSVKFTLRVTPTIYDYIEKRSRKQKMTKAVYLRNLVLRELTTVD